MKTYQARVARTMIRGRLAYQIDGQVTLVIAADPDPETTVPNTIFVPTIAAYTVAALLKDA